MATSKQSEQDGLSDFEDLFSKVFVGQMSLIVALQQKCIKSTDERDHENLESAINGYEILMSTARANAGSMMFASRSNN